MIATQGSEVYIGVDNTTITNPNDKGRSSVRIESKSKYNHGLFIAKFSHLPKPVCGTWPAFWMYGDDWPSNGEIDIYENWNDATVNSMAFHTDAASKVGSCTLNQADFSSPLVSQNCDINAPGQSSNQGCSANEAGGQWGNSKGGVCKLLASSFRPCHLRRVQNHRHSC